MNSKNHFDRIEEYLAGDLTEQEMSAFEQEMNSDTTLQKTVDKHITAHDAVELIIEQNLREDFKQWRQEEMADKKDDMPQIGRRTTFRFTKMARVYAIAASVVLLLGVGLWNVLGDSGLSNEELAATYYEAPNYAEFRNAAELPDGATGMDLEPAFEEGLNALQTNDFEKAVQAFTQIPETSPRYEQVQFYLGHCHYQLKNYENASIALQLAANGNDVKVKDEAEWYLIVNWIASDQKDEQFQTLLNKIAEDEGHSFERKAKKLIKDLK